MPVEQTDAGQQATTLPRPVYEAEQTLQAIRNGEVDSLVVRSRGGSQLVTLRPVDVLYRVFFEELPHGAATLGPDGTILYCNPRLGLMLSTRCERLIGASWNTFVAEQDQAEVARMLHLPLGERYEAELTLLATDGTLVLVEAAASSFCAEETPLTCLILTDITEHRRREEELHKIKWLLGKSRPRPVKESYEQPYGNLVQLNTSRLLADTVGTQALNDVVANYLDLLDTSAAIYEKNGDYALGIFSSGWCRFMDQASRNLCGTTDNTAALSSGRWLCHESCWECSKVSMASGQPVDIECKGGIHLYAVPVRAGEEVVGSINFGYGNPPRDETKLRELADAYQVSVEELRRRASEYETRPPFLIDIAKDRLKTSAALLGSIIEARQARTRAETISRELERRVEERTAELQAANQELESFAYSISHDLRAPLRAIDGFSRILHEEHGPLLPAEAQGLLDQVRAGAQRMGKLIDDLLAFSRLGQQAITMEMVRPDELVAEILRLLQPALEGRPLDWQIGPLPPCRADRSLLRQVFFNLLGNAVKFTRHRTPGRIEVGARSGERPGEIVYFVKDNGAGFDMQYANKLFGVFQRLHSPTEFEGTGVGLALVQRILHKHGGCIWAEAAVEQGATFSFSLPTEVKS